MAGENAVRPKGIKAKLENFWYHYKFYTVACVIAALAVIVSVAQCSSAPRYDYKIVVATESVALSPLQLEAVEQSLKRYCEDLNGDGSVEVLLHNCTEDKENTDPQMHLTLQQKLQSLVMSEHECLLFITDKGRFEWIDGLGKSGFIANTGLADNGGKSLSLDRTDLITHAKELCDPKDQMLWPRELFISRRAVEGTLFEQKEGIEEITKRSDELVQKIAKGKQAE